MVLVLASAASSACSLVAGFQTLNEGASDAGAPSDPAATPGAAPVSEAGAPAVSAEDAGDSGGGAAATEAGPDATEPGPFTPASLGAGLVVWLDASRGVTQAAGKVSLWADQSGRGNDAAQTVTARQPSVHPGALAKKPTIAFDGAASGLALADAASLRWGLDDYTIEIVAEYTNTPSTDDVVGYGALWTKGTPAYPYPGVALFANSIAGSATSNLLVQVKTPDDTPRGWVNSKADGLNDGTFRVYGTRRVGQTTLEARVDGAITAATIAAVDVSTGGQPVFIGSRDGSLQLLHGEIAEIVAYRGALSDADIATLEAYLRTKYTP